MRTTILGVGLCATALTAFVAIPLSIFVPYENPTTARIILAFALAGAAIAGPLFGTIAGSHEERWKPLLTGCGLGLLTLIIMFELI
jgi:hypothetical protein